VVDGTFASPYLQQPIALGADLVIYSTTKYLSGHSDITGGAVIAAGGEVGAAISRHVGMLGTAAAPQEAWLVQRGIKTLPVRMRQICASSQRIAEFLAAHPAGQPGCTTRTARPSRPPAGRQAVPGGSGGVVSVELQSDPDAAGRVCERTQVFTLAVPLDFTRPVAITMLGILPFIDDDEAQAIVARLMAAVPAGSYLAITTPPARSPVSG
jgi:cystathionine gamma-synthase